MHGTYQKFQRTSEQSVPNQPRDRATEGDALISVAQTAAMLGVHPNTIRAWTDAGRLVAYRINARGDRRYRRGDVQRLLTEGAGAGETQERPGATELKDPQLAVLGRITQGTIGVTSAAAVCRVVVEALRTTMGIERAAVYLRDEAEEGALVLETHAGYQVAPPVRLGSTPLPADGEHHLPLRAAGTEVGLLVIAAGEERELDGTFLSAVAASLAGHVRSARILARARRELTRSRALRGVIQELTGQLDLPNVLEDVVSRTRALFEADRAGLWLMGESDHPFIEAAMHGLSDVFRAAVRGISWDDDAAGIRAIRDRRPYVLHTDRDSWVGPLGPLYVSEGIVSICLVPLVAHDEAVGILGLFHTEHRPWPSEEVALAQAFANQAAVAISNARLYRSVADQAARMRSIQDLSARLNRLTDVTAIGEAIVAEANSLAEYHDIRIYRVDWERRVCEPIAYTDRLLGEGDFRERLTVDIGPGSFTGTVAESAEPMLINDALHDDRGQTIDGTDDIEESMLVVPMVYEGRAVGVIALSKLGVNQFSTDDLQTMTIFAGYAAQAMANATAYERLSSQSAVLARQLDSQRRLLAINEQLLSTLDPSEVLESIADGLRSVVDYDNLSIYRADHEARRMLPVLARERFADEVMQHIVPFGRGLMGWVVAHGEAVCVNDALADARAIQIPGTTPDPEAIIIVPLVAGGVVIGTLNVGRIGTQEIYFTQTDFELVQLFAGQASIALRNAEAHHQVALRADTDALTGLGNHGAFQRRLAELVAERQQATQPEPLALLMMDLDNFKAYNDSLGHPAGDALLHAVSGAISSAARGTDHVYRYGGDEFALIVPGVDQAVAVAIGERVRSAVARLTERESAVVTITVGVATLPTDAIDKNGLISAADTALYFGKRSGENCLVRAADVPREMHQLRGTLDQLARAALQGTSDRSVEQLVERAARLSSASDHDGDSMRDTLLSVARSLDARDAHARGHADRVGRLAHRIAVELGMDDDEARTVELGARLHGLEVLGVAELEPIPSLRGVTEIIRWNRRDGAIARRAPLSAQVVGLANAFDTLTVLDRPRATRPQALADLRALAGRRWKAGVVDALARAIGVDERSARRRRADRTIVEGAA